MGRLAGVAAAHGVSRRKLLWILIPPGKLASAIYRLWRARLTTRRSASRGLRAEPIPRRAQRDGSDSVGPLTCPRSLYIIPAAPGSWPSLADTLDSVLAFEGDSAGVLVVDDCTFDCREAVVRSSFPQVAVIRTRRPSGGPPRLSGLMGSSLSRALRAHQFDVAFKLDTDALITGPGLGSAAAEFFAARPEVGMIGGLEVRADGQPEDYSYDALVLHSEVWLSRRVRSVLDRARANGFSGAKVHGGVCAMSRVALEALDAQGLLTLPSPWWSAISDDVWLSLIMLAGGFSLGSFAGPKDPIVSASHYLPLDKEEVLRSGKLAVHSVRRGLAGEGEAELRAFFRSARLSASA
jgi:hypothetical protein